MTSSIQSYASPASHANTTKTANFEQEDLRAVQMTEHLFEKWVRNLKTAYTAPVQGRRPQKNVNGVDLPPPIKDIKYNLLQKEGKDVILKDKVLPVERLTAVTLFSDRPYLHLMLSVTNPEIRNFTYDFMHKTSKYCDQTTELPSHMVPVI